MAQEDPENIDASPIPQSQVPSPDKKNCTYCRTPIHPDASICKHCRYHQRWCLNYFRIEQLGIVVSIGLLLLSLWQLNVALQQRTKADEALQRASEVEQLAKRTESLVDFNFLLTKVSHDDRKAFDDMWRASQTPQHAFQELARGAVHTILMSNIPLTPDSALVERLQGLEYDALLQYYQDNPHQGPSILHAAGGNTQMTEERKADFIAGMIAEDTSFRVVQWSCLFIQARLKGYQQANLAGYERVSAQCQVYGKLWDYYYLR